MGVRQLQQECRDRGLPTARDKETLVARLTEADSGPGPHLGEGEHVLSREAVREAASAAAFTPPGPAPVVHREVFPARDGGPDDAEHAACRASTIAAAQAHGYTPQGDAYRVGTVDGMYVYEVHLQRGGAR